MLHKCHGLLNNLVSPIFSFTFHTKIIPKRVLSSNSNNSHCQSVNLFTAHNLLYFSRPIISSKTLNCKMSETTVKAGEKPTETIEEPARLALEIFKSAVESVKVPTLLRQKLSIENGSNLKIKGKPIVLVNLNKFKRIFVIGFGKAVLPMAEEVKAILGNRVNRCMVNIPEGFRDSTDPEIEIHRGAKSNIPDIAAYNGTKKIVKLVQDCLPDDLLIVLISGGGSALLPYPISPITIEEMSSLVKDLSKAGATINELNAVRKRISLVKGGGLRNLCKCTKVVSLILSDVIGDPLDIIASGPTVPNKDPDFLAKVIIKKYMDFNSLPNSIQKVLDSKMPSLPPKDVTNIIIGNNSIALDSAATTAKSLNLYPIIVTNMLSGEAKVIGEELGHALPSMSFLFRSKKTDLYINAYQDALYRFGVRIKIAREKITALVETLLDENIQKNYDGVCILFGGETTVEVRGKGVGGRNQELVLYAAVKMDVACRNDYVEGKVAVLSGGTDGFDGPSDAAGAVMDSSTIRKGYENQLMASTYAGQNNSYNYFKDNSNGAYHIITGHTETNVMDIVVLVILK